MQVQIDVCAMLKRPLLLLSLVVTTTMVDATDASTGLALHALVIGNSAYQVQALTNPVRDAQLIGDTLGDLGFNVTLINNLGRQAMFEATRDFYANLPAASVAMVFYAGHGMQLGGANYLLPVDVTPTSEQGIRLRAYPLANLLEHAERSSAVINIVVLDACRNNPFLPGAGRQTRSFEGLGLARVSSPRGTIVAYSTAPGQLAEDGEGRRHSVYAQMLATELMRPGRTVEEILKAVADAVRRITLDDQQPWFETSLVDDFFFQPPPGVAMVTLAPQRQEPRSTVANRATVADSDTRAGEHWFQQLDEQGWTTLDWEIDQRVRRLTRDELPLLEHRALNGNLIAQTTLGIVWREGPDRLVEHQSGRTLRTGGNNTEALRWLRMAAEAGFPMAQVELGEMYYQGHGVERDLQTSIHWLERSAAAPYPRARMNLAQALMIAAPTAETLKNLAVETMRENLRMLIIPHE